MKMSNVFNLPLVSNCHGQVKESNGAFIFHGASTFEEDAKAIAVCVNNHDALVEALEEIMYDEVDIECALGTDLYDKCKDLLSKVKG